MSRHHHVLLRKLCNGATLEKAKSILHTATIKTVQGSGYELGQGSSGLPAICAYLAAEELGDTEINEKTAQTASCLKPKVFQTTLNTVRSALAAVSSSPHKSSRTVTYIKLVELYRIGRKGMVTTWMADAERTLMANREIRRRFGSAYDAITIAVFCWTLELMGRKIDQAVLLDRYRAPKEQVEELKEALHDLCNDVAEEVKSVIASLKAETANNKTTKIRPSTALSSAPSTQLPALPPPTVRSTPKSPSKSALRAPSVDLSPTKTPSHKRKVAFDATIEEEDEEFDIHATPSKRQKFSSPPKPSASTSVTPRLSARLVAAASKPSEVIADDVLQPVAGPSTPRRQRTSPLQPSSTHSSRSVRSSRSHAAASGSAPSTPRRRPALPTVQEVDEAPRRRYRPVFVDQQQWLKGDSRLERELKGWSERWGELVRKAGGDVWKAAGLAASASGTVSVTS